MWTAITGNMSKFLSSVRGFATLRAGKPKTRAPREDVVLEHDTPTPETDPRIKVLLSELTDQKHLAESHSNLRAQAERELQSCRLSHSQTQQELTSLQAAYSHSQQQLEITKRQLETSPKTEHEELDSWKDAAEEYLQNARDFESRLRDAQIRHREEEMEWKGRVLEARQTGTLPLILAMLGSSALTFLVYHGKTLLDHRKNLMMINEAEREWLDKQAELTKKYENSLEEISRLRATPAPQRWFYNCFSIFISDEQILSGDSEF